MATRKPIDLATAFLGGGYSAPLSPPQAPPAHGEIPQYSSAPVAPPSAPPAHGEIPGGPTQQYIPPVAPNARPGLKPGGDPGVWDLQNQLNSKGAGIETDGLMGPQTRSAMSRYNMGGAPVSPAQGPAPTGGLPPTPTPASPTAATTGATGSGFDTYLSQLMQALGPGPSAPSWDPQQTALDMINQQYTSQEGTLGREMQANNSNLATQQEQQNLYGNNADQRLQSVYQALQNDLARNQGQTAGIYDQTQQAVQGSYDQAAQGLQGLNQGIIGQLLSGAQNLGIGQGAGDPLARIAQQYQSQAGTNIQSKANSLAGLDIDKANSLGLGISGMNSASKQGAQARADTAMGVRGTLAQLGLQNAQSNTELQGQLADLEKTKASDYRNTLAQLAQTLYGQQRQSRLDQLAEMVQLGTLATQRQYMDVRQQTADQNFQLGLGNLDIQQQGIGEKQAELAQQLQLARDPVALQQIMGTLGLQQAQGQYYQQHGDYFANGGSGAQGQVHNDQLLQFFATPQPGLWGADGAGPKFQQALIDPNNGIITQAQQQAKLAGVDPFTYATALAPGIAKAQNLDLNGLLNALSVYFRGQ